MVKKVDISQRKAAKRPEIDPKLLLEAAISVERDLSILTGPELVSKYASDSAGLVLDRKSVV